MHYIAIGIGLTIGNVIWAFKSKDWEDAAKISFFQIIAVACCALIP
jgi:hypothetical protein